VKGGRKNWYEHETKPTNDAPQEGRNNRRTLLITGGKLGCRPVVVAALATVEEQNLLSVAGTHTDSFPQLVACVWRIADFPQKSAIRRTHVGGVLIHRTIVTLGDGVECSNLTSIRSRQLFKSGDAAARRRVESRDAPPATRPLFSGRSMLPAGRSDK